MDSSKAGNCSALKAMLGANERLLNYQGQGTNYSFTGHTALHWAASKNQVSSLSSLSVPIGALCAFVYVCGERGNHGGRDLWIHEDVSIRGIVSECVCVGGGSLYCVCAADALVCARVCVCRGLLVLEECGGRRRSLCVCVCVCVCVCIVC
jgi:hypothetical protein